MKKKLYFAGMALCAIVFCFSSFQLIRYYATAKKADSDFDKLAQLVSQTEDAGAEEAKETTTNPGGEAIDDQAILEGYRKLQEQNKDMAGWISIEGTKINYPVMHTPDSPDYYLKHNFEKEYSAYGTPYIAEHCDLERPSDNLIIYGHHMKNGSMFTGLMNYQEKEFYEEYPFIQFDTLTERGKYQIFAVFVTTVNEGEGFPYYQFVDAWEEKEFDAYIAQCRELSLYDTGVTAEYGDKLITLSTCEYSNDNGRLVVVAKKLA